MIIIINELEYMLGDLFDLYIYSISILIVIGIYSWIKILHIYKNEINL